MTMSNRFNLLLEQYDMELNGWTLKLFNINLGQAFFLHFLAKLNGTSLTNKDFGKVWGEIDEKEAENDKYLI